MSLMVLRPRLLAEERQKDIQSAALCIALSLAAIGSQCKHLYQSLTTTPKKPVATASTQEEVPPIPAAPIQVHTPEEVPVVRQYASPFAIDQGPTIMLASAHVRPELSTLLLKKTSLWDVGVSYLPEPELLPPPEAEPLIPHFTDLEPGTDITNKPFRFGEGDTEVTVTLSEHVGDIVISGTRGDFRVSKLTVGSLLSQEFKPEAEDPYGFCFTVTETGVSVCITIATDLPLMDETVMVPIGTCTVSKEDIEARFKLAAASVPKGKQEFTVEDSFTSANFALIPKDKD